jgi:hypothetical protein
MIVYVLSVLIWKLLDPVSIILVFAVTFIMRRGWPATIIIATLTPVVFEAGMNAWHGREFSLVNNLLSLGADVIWAGIAAFAKKTTEDRAVARAFAGQSDLDAEG